MTYHFLIASPDCYHVPFGGQRSMSKHRTILVGEQTKGKYTQIGGVGADDKEQDRRQKAKGKGSVHLEL